MLYGINDKQMKEFVSLAEAVNTATVDDDCQFCREFRKDTETCRLNECKYEETDNG